MKVRNHITPELNFFANHIKELISWDKDIHEPVFTCCRSLEEIDMLVDFPFDTEEYSIHTQSTERGVKLVTEASGAIAGVEAIWLLQSQSPALGLASQV